MDSIRFRSFDEEVDIPANIAAKTSRIMQFLDDEKESIATAFCRLKKIPVKLYEDFSKSTDEKKNIYYDIITLKFAESYMGKLNDENAKRVKGFIDSLMSKVSKNDISDIN